MANDSSSIGPPAGGQAPQFFLERVLLVAGDPHTGKSTQLRSMFKDPRMGTHGNIPSTRRLRTAYMLSPFRHLYLRLTSPHESGESLSTFLGKISHGAQGRWNVATPIQIGAAGKMPDLTTVVHALGTHFSPERIRVAILSPDCHGNPLHSAPQVMANVLGIQFCEALCIDARTRDGNGLLLADTFDFA